MVTPRKVCASATSRPATVTVTVADPAVMSAADSIRPSTHAFEVPAAESGPESVVHPGAEEIVVVLSWISTDAIIASPACAPAGIGIVAVAWLVVSASPYCVLPMKLGPVTGAFSATEPEAQVVDVVP